MLIRSQDKKILCPFNGMGVIPLTKDEKEIKIIKYIVVISVDGNEVEIGEYSTEEKAIKVLDMIEKAYCKSFEEQKDNYQGHRYGLVFKMPQNEEV